MEWQWYILGISLLPSLYSNVVLTPEFENFFQSLSQDQSDRAKFKIKLYNKLLKYGSFVAVANSRPFSIENLTACHSNLVHIMEEELNCPTAANEMQLVLDILEFEHNVTYNVVFAQGFYGENCKILNGKSNDICSFLLSGEDDTRATYKMFITLIDKCLIEYQRQSEERNTTLSRR